MTVRAPLDLASLLDPRGVAVIGASPDSSRHHGRPTANLERTGYRGQVYPVNPRHDRVGPWPCLDHVSEAAGPVDLAYVMVRAELVEAAVRDCAAAGVGTVVVCSSGFAEEGPDGAAAQRRLVEAAGPTTRLIGPNCIGVVAVPERVVSCTTMNVTEQQSPGGLAIVSQSGGMAVNVFNRAQGRGVGARALVSVGNECDVDLAEVVRGLADDPQVTTIFCYVEQLRDPVRFAEAVRAARQAGQVVVVLKVGASEAGARSALSHTGALAGSHAVFTAMMAHLGVVVVSTIDEVVDIAALADAGVLPLGRRVMVVSPSGGECGYVADAAHRAGVPLPALSDSLAATLAEGMRFGTPSNPLDLTGQVIGDDGLFGSVLDTIGASGEVDAIVVALPTWGEVDSRRLVPGILGVAGAAPVPVLVTAWSAPGLTEHRDALLRESPVPTFADADGLMAAVAALGRVAAVTDPPHLERTWPDVQVDPAAVRHEVAAKALLRSHGLATSAEELCQDLEGVVAAAERLGWPVVLKGVVSGVAHKSELGLVTTDLADRERLCEAVASLERRCADQRVRLDGYLIAHQYDGIEMIVGGVRDETFGPVVLIGAGGVLAEAMDDVTFVPCPSDQTTVRSALESLAIGRLLRGFRGVTYDVDAAVAFVTGFSALFPRLAGIDQVDLNPVIVSRVGTGGAHAVDALLVPTADG